YYKYKDYLFYRNIFGAVKRSPDKNEVNKNHIIFNAIYANVKKNFIEMCAKTKGYLKHFDTKDNPKSNNHCAHINYILNTEIQKSLYKAKSYTF
ncbi:hypothetical protein PVNG_06289, partial [Plasmodium vivax North Korean]